MLFGPPVPLGGHVQQICGHIAGFHTLPIHVRGMEHVRPRRNGNAPCGTAAHSHPYIGPCLVVREHNAPIESAHGGQYPPEPRHTIVSGAAPPAILHMEGRHGQPLSTSMAIPCPPPMHSVANPLLCPFRFSVCKSVTRIRAPEAPIGCPRAMAPPLIFTLSRLKPSSRPTARNWAAKASLASI